MEQTIIAEGCMIRAKSIVNSVIGIRSRIGEGTDMKSCYMMGSDFYETLSEIAYNHSKGIPMVGVGDFCELTNVIMDKDCRIGNHVKIVGGAHVQDGDHSCYTIKDGIVVIKKGAIIADGTVIGVE